MNAEKRAYSSTVVSRGHVLLGAVAGAAVGVLMFAALPASPIGPLLAGVAVFVIGLYLATVRVAIGAGRIVLSQGPFGHRGRVIPISLIAEAHAEKLSRSQVFGIGVPWHWRTTRMTVRSGPTLVVRLTTGEYIRVSTPDPGAAVEIIRSAHPFPSTPAPA